MADTETTDVPQPQTENVEENVDGGVETNVDQNVEQGIEQSTEQMEDQTSCEVCEFIHDAILDQQEMKKIFVGGITPDSTTEELKEFFEKISGGNVIDHIIMKKDGEKSKSHFGFVTFETSELVDDVLLKRNELRFKNRLLDVNRAVPKHITSAGAHQKTKKLFIANLPKFDCTEEDLMTYFKARHPEKYGVIESIQLIKKKDESGNKTNENKGFGFIMVSNEDMADKMAIQHSSFEYGGRKIELKKSVPTTPEGGGRGRGRGSGGGGGGVAPGQGYYHPGYGYGPYGGYGYGSYGWDGYGGYEGYDMYGYSSRGGGSGGGRGARGAGTGRARFTPY